MANSRLVQNLDAGGASVVPAPGVAQPAIQAVVVVDPNGNLPGDATYVGGGGTSVQKVSAGGAAQGQSLKQFTGKIALLNPGPTLQALYTVTAGKTFYVTDLFVSHDSNAVVELHLQTSGGVDGFRAPVKGDTAPLQMPGIETQPQFAAGQAVQLRWETTVPAATPNAYFFVAGFEQ